MFSVFGVISSGGVQVVGIAVRQSTLLSREAQVGLFPRHRGRNLKLADPPRPRRCNKFQAVLNLLTLYMERAFSSPVILNRSGFK